MFLLIVIVILIAATSILANIYGGIFSFQLNYGDLENYSNSHYAAISAIERGLLVTKYKKPSFVGSGGFFGTGAWGEVSELFSGNFGEFNKDNNGLYRKILSQNNNGTGILTNNNTLTIYTYTYDNTLGHYEDDGNAINTDGISDGGEINGVIENIDNSINLINGNLYRQINGDSEINGYTGFVASSGTTMINYGEINDQNHIEFNSTTKNPIARLSGDILCTENGCYTGQTIGNLIGSNNDKGIIIYIQDRLKDTNNHQIGSIKYNLTNNFSGNTQEYYIDGTAIIGKYKQELSIKKPTFNYRNPNRKKFIFPYYN